MLAAQDGAVKLLPASLTLPLIPAMRSGAILGLGLAMGGRRRPRSVFHRPVRGLLLCRAVVNLLAWLACFSPARSLPLGPLASPQFLAPLIVVLASGWMLGDHGGRRHRLLVVPATGGALVSGGSLGFEVQQALPLALVAALAPALAERPLLVAVLGGGRPIRPVHRGTVGAGARHGAA